MKKSRKKKVCLIQKVFGKKLMKLFEKKTTLGNTFYCGTTFFIAFRVFVQMTERERKRERERDRQTDQCLDRQKDI